MGEEYAFPGKVADPGEPRFTGMTLRDWFAGQALAGLMAATYTGDWKTRDFAKTAYRLADAMLRAMEK